MKKHIFIFIFSVWTSIAFSQTFSQNRSDNPEQYKKASIHQLRIYDVPKENSAAFHNRFRDQRSAGKLISLPGTTNV